MILRPVTWAVGPGWYGAGPSALELLAHEHHRSGTQSVAFMAETINYAAKHNGVVLVDPRSANGAALYQRGAKPHDKGHLEITFHNPRAESPDYYCRVFVYFVYFVVDAMFIQPTRPELSSG